jgi:hypothetical protein
MKIIFLDIDGVLNVIPEDNKNLKYKLMDAKPIKINDLKKLINEDKVELTDRYKEKLKNYA